MATQIIVNWTYSLLDNTGFLLQRVVDFGTIWSGNFTTDASTTQYIDSDVAVGKTYSYKVAATNAFGTGSFSNTGSIYIASTGSVTLYLTIGPTTDVKTYDGTITSSVTPAILSGSIAAGDTASFVQYFDTKHAATGKLLIPTGSVTGSSGVIYNITFISNSIGQIDPINIDVLGAFDSKAFDGTISSSVIPTFSIPLFTGDITSSVSTQSFANKFVGIDKNMVPNLATIIINDGNSGNNYVVNQNSQPIGIITGPPTGSLLSNYIGVPADTDMPYEPDWSVTIYDITSGSNGFLTFDTLNNAGWVAVLTSSNLINWVVIASASYQPRCQAFGSGTYVGLNAFGNESDAQYSTDGGLTWIATTVPTTDVMIDALYDGAQFVACGVGGTILTSSNGINWKVESIGNTDFLNRIIYNGGRYVAVGPIALSGYSLTSTGTIYTSTNLISWQAVSSSIPTTAGYYDVTYSPSLGIYVAVGEAGLMATSSNGIDWMDNSHPAPIYQTSLTSITWNSVESYFAVSDFDGYIYNSTDGITWTLNTINPHLIYNGDYYTYVLRMKYYNLINKFAVIGTPPPV